MLGLKFSLKLGLSFALFASSALGMTMAMALRPSDEPSLTNSSDDQSPARPVSSKKSVGETMLDSQSQPLNATPSSSTSDLRRDLATTGWITLDRCPVFSPETIDVPAQDTGVIRELNIQVNSSVEAGQLLGKLDSSIADIELNISGLQAQMASAEAKDESDIRLAEAIVEEAQLQESDYEILYNKRGVSDSDYRQRQLSTKQAKVRLTQAIANAKQREMKAKLAQAGLTLAQRKLDKLLIASPVTGRVKEISHRTGEWVPAGTTIAKIIRMDEMRIDAFIQIDQLELNSILQQPVQVTLQQSGKSRTFAGRLDSYSSEVSANGNVRIHALVQNQKEGEQWVLLPGMTVSMKFRATR